MPRCLTLTQSAEVAAFAESYARERFGFEVSVQVVSKSQQDTRSFLRAVIGSRIANFGHLATFYRRRSQCQAPAKASTEAQAWAGASTNSV